MSELTAAIDDRPTAVPSDRDQPAAAHPKGTGPAPGLDLSPLFILLALGLVVGTILHRPNIFYCPNDSSRLNTVYYLIRHGTYTFTPDTDVSWASRTAAKINPADPTTLPVLWTIDMIMVDGKLCSSKPPLLSTCLAGVVWVTQKITGLTLLEHPLVMIRTMLLVSQVLPFAICLLLLRRHIFRMTESPFARNFSIGTACLATYLTPWQITINNHVVAAATGMIALDAALRIWYENRREWYRFVQAGFFASLTAAFELPAGLLAVTLFVALLAKDRKRTLVFGLIAAALPAAAGLYTNHLATGQFMPAYESWNKPGGFYDYPGSYWNNRTGVDALNEPKHIYMTNMLVGHDGFFSLTPVLLVCLTGLIAELVRRGVCRALAAVVLLITTAIVITYTIETNNYGGGCQGFRWLFWVLPMWLLFLPRGVKIMSGNIGGRTILYALFAISVFSVGYAWDNPWTGNWLRLLFNTFGWIDY